MQMHYLIDAHVTVCIIHDGEEITNNTAFRLQHCGDSSIILDLRFNQTKISIIGSQIVIYN
jgi:hypothetical protein